jgi:hypothetical protein
MQEKPGKGSAFDRGARGRGFESRRPDFIFNKINDLNISSRIAKMPNKIQEAAWTHHLPYYSNY